MNVRQIIYLILIVLLSFSIVTETSLVRADESAEPLSSTNSEPSLKGSQSDNGLMIEWALTLKNRFRRRRSIRNWQRKMPRIRLNGYELLMQLQTVILSGDQDAEIELNYVESSSWTDSA